MQRCKHILTFKIKEQLKKRQIRKKNASRGLCIKEIIYSLFIHPFCFPFFLSGTLTAALSCAFLVSKAAYFLAWREFAPLAIGSGYGHDVPQYQIYNNRGKKAGRLHGAEHRLFSENTLPAACSNSRPLPQEQPSASCSASQYGK